MSLTSSTELMVLSSTHHVLSYLSVLFLRSAFLMLCCVLLILLFRLLGDLLLESPGEGAGHRNFQSTIYFSHSHTL